jgi:trigger factor
MQVKVEQQGPCEVELNIEVPAEQVSTTRDKVFKEIGQYTTVPGFRRGKAPKVLLERHLSPESVRRHLLDELLPDAYAEALEEAKIEPYTDPEVEIVQLEKEQPFIFKAKVPLPPKIELGEYKGIEVERPEVTVTDEDIDSELEYLRQNHASIEPIEDRPVQSGDIVTADLGVVIEGEEPQEPGRARIRVGSNIPEFDDNIVGMNLGEERSFAIEYASDFADEDLAGKKVDYTVKIEKIYEVKLPELNDEFAQSLEGSIETLDALKENIRSRLTEARNRSADNEVENKIIEAIVSRSTVCFPDVILKSRVAHELEHLREDLEKENRSFKQYLEQVGRTREEFMDELNQAISRRVTVGLVLGELAAKENLEVADEEVDARIDTMVEESKTTREAVEAYLEPRGGRESLENALLDQKITDFIKSVSKIKSGESGG